MNRKKWIAIAAACVLVIGTCTAVFFGFWNRPQEKEPDVSAGTQPQESGGKDSCRVAFEAGEHGTVLKEDGDVYEILSENFSYEDTGTLDMGITGVQGEDGSLKFSYLGNINDNGDKFTYSGVTVPKDGEYQLKLLYTSANEGANSHSVYVNGERQKVIQYAPTGTWDNLTGGAEAAVTVGLKKGENTISFVRETGNQGYAQVGRLTLVTQTYETDETVKAGESPKTVPAAQGDAGYCFAGWKGPDGNIIDPLKTKITGDTVFTAAFAPDQDGNGVPDDEDSTVQITYTAGENGSLFREEPAGTTVYPVTGGEPTYGTDSAMDRYEFWQEFEGKGYGVAFNLDKIGDGVAFHVQADTDGAFELSLPYSSEIACSTHTVKVNGEYAGKLVYTGFGKWGEFSTGHTAWLSVNLKRGGNVIWIGKTGSDAGAAMISDLTVSSCAGTNRLTERVKKGEKPSQVPLAQAALGYQFAGWRLQGAGEYLSPDSRAATGHMAYEAVFSEDPSYQAPANPSGGGETDGQGTAYYSDPNVYATFSASEGGKVYNLPMSALENVGSSTITYWEDDTAMYKSGIQSVDDSPESADKAEKGYYDGQSRAGEGYGFETFYAYNLNDPGDSVNYAGFTAPADGWYRFRSYYSSTFTQSTHSLFVDGKKAGTFVYQGSSGAWGVFSHSHYADCMVYLTKGSHSIALGRTQDDVAYAMPSDLYIAVRFGGQSITVPVAPGTAVKAVPSAQADSGYQFKGWQDQNGRTVNPASQAISQNTAFTAVFEKDQHYEPPVEEETARRVTFQAGANGKVYNLPQSALENADASSVTYYDNGNAMFKAPILSVTDQNISEDKAGRGYYDGLTEAVSGYGFETFYAYNLDDPGDTVDYGVFNAPADGYYSLRLYYASTFEKSSHTVSVNGNSAGRFVYQGSSGKWGAFSHSYYADCVLYLSKGENRITLNRGEDDTGYAMVSDLYVSVRYGDDTLSIPVEQGGALKGTPAVEANACWIFTGWLDSQGNAVDPAAVKITEDTVFTAAYQEDLNGNGVPDSQEDLVEIRYEAGSGGILNQRYKIAAVQKGPGSTLGVYEDGDWKHAYNLDVTGDGVSYYVVAPEAGTYTVKVRYACGADQPTTMSVWAGGVLQGKLQLNNYQDGWNFNTERYAEMTVALHKGMNVVTVGREEDDGAAMLSDLYLVAGTAAEYVASGETAKNVPQAVGNPGAAFSGWEDAAQGVINPWEVAVTQNTVYTAVYKTDTNHNGVPDEEERKVTYQLKPEDAANGAALNGAAEEWVRLGESPASVPVPTMSGRLFEGWMDAQGGPVNPAEAVIQDDTVYTAVFSDSVTVTYQAQGSGRLAVATLSPASVQDVGNMTAGRWEIGDGWWKVANLDDIGDCAVYEIQAPSAGDYTLKVRYSTGNANASHSVWVNDGYAGSMLYADANGWDAWSDPKYAELQVTLKEGQNVVKIGRGGEYDGYAQLAEICVLASSYTEKVHVGDAPAWVPTPIAGGDASFNGWDQQPGAAVVRDTVYTAKFSE